MITLLYGIFCTWCDEFFSAQSNCGLVMITNFITLTVSVTLSQQIYLPYIDKPKPVPIVHNIFVYGTLKRGEPNHYWLKNPENGLSKFMKRAITVAKYPLVVGQKYNTPFLLKNPGIGNHIFGEVYIIDNFMLRNLDKLKGAPVYYHREIDVVRFLQTDSDDNDEILCWIYFANADPPKNLQSFNMISNYCSQCNANETIYI